MFFLGGISEPWTGLDWPLITSVHLYYSLNVNMLPAIRAFDLNIVRTFLCGTQHKVPHLLWHSWNILDTEQFTPGIYSRGYYLRIYITCLIKLSEPKHFDMVLCANTQPVCRVGNANLCGVVKCYMERKQYASEGVGGLV